MSEFWKTKKFTKLSEKWEKNLYDSGFKDAEETIGGVRKLRQYASNVYRTREWINIDAKYEFYTLVSSQAVLDGEMKPHEKIIMTKFSEGHKQSDIIEELTRGGMRCNRITITRTITKFLHKWKIPHLKARKTK